MYLKEVVHQSKNRGSRHYLQFVESVRTVDGPRQNILVNVGRIDNKTGRQRLEVLTSSLLKLSETIHLIDVEKDIEGKSSKQLGMELIFRRLFEQIGIKQILDKVFCGVRADFDVKDALFNLVLNRLSCPTSKAAVNDWQQDEYKINHYDPQHYYRSMDHLYEERETVEKELFSQLKSLSTARDKDLSIALFDTTSVVYYGEGDEEESFLDYGFSKARRSDLKQIVVGVAMTKDGIPVSHETYSGNTNDVSCFKQMIEKFTDKHDQKKVTFVGDRGLITNKNIELLVDSGYQYLLGFRMRTIPKADRAALLNKADLINLKKNLDYRDLEYKGRRLIISYNEERAEKDRAKRDEILEKIKDKIKGGTIKSIVSNKDYKKFLNIEGKDPVLDQKKVDADAVFDGVFILTTNTKLHPTQAVDTYRKLWQCEAGFRTLKSELELQPLFHRKERRIRAHVLICFLALVCKNLLIKTIREIDNRASYRQVILDLKRLQAISLKIHKTNVTTRTEIGDSAKLAFKALKMAFPKKVLAHDNENLIAISH
jgi:transposase